MYKSGLFFHTVSRVTAPQILSMINYEYINKSNPSSFTPESKHRSSSHSASVHPSLKTEPKQMDRHTEIKTSRRLKQREQKWHLVRRCNQQKSHFKRHFHNIKRADWSKSLYWCTPTDFGELQDPYVCLKSHWHRDGTQNWPWTKKQTGIKENRNLFQPNFYLVHPTSFTYSHMMYASK